MAIEVSLDINANPPVTVKPAIHNVNQGNQTIEWKPAAQQSFTFYAIDIPDPAVSPPTPNPFGTPSVGTDQITVTDNNSGAANGVTYFYVITVLYNGVQYKSGSNGIGGGTGNPSIKNN